MFRTFDELFDRNVAWAEAKTRKDPTFFRRPTEQHSPKYPWIGCFGSRVAANDVLGLDPGEVFVHRNIAGIVRTRAHHQPAGQAGIHCDLPHFGVRGGTVLHRTDRRAAFRNPA